MDPMVMGMLILLFFLAIILLGMPVSYSMIIASLIGILLFRSPAAAFESIAGSLVTTFASYSYSVIPMFILLGYIALVSGMGQSLFDTTNKLVGQYRGGLALAVQGACAIFGAITGSMSATVATIGSIALPEMKRYKYSDALAAASIACGASLATLIPPSVFLVVYGILTEQSISKLFMAGIIPGILQMLFYMIAIITATRINPTLAPAGPKFTAREKFDAIVRGDLKYIVIVFAISMGGLFLGYFTPTEAGAVGAAGLFIVSLIKKKMNTQVLKEALSKTVNLTAMVFLLCAGAVALSRFFAYTRASYAIGDWLMGLNISSFGILLIIFLIYFLLGFFIDALALVLLTLPIFYPIITELLGFSPIWFGVSLLVVMSLASVTPPVGINLFLVKAIKPELTISEIVRGIWPFVIADLALLIVLMIFPQVVTWLPDLLV